MDSYFSTSTSGTSQHLQFSTATSLPAGQAPPSPPGQTSHSGKTHNINVTSNPTPAIHEQEAVDFDSIPAAAFSYNPVLDADLMTPDYTDSFQSEHTTPQERIWEEQFITQEPLQPELTDLHHPNTFHNASAPAGLQQSTYNGTVSLAADENLPKYVTASQLLSPQLTTPSPPAPAHRTLSQQGAMMLPTSPAQVEDHPPTQLSLTAEALNLSQTSGYNIAPSPIVIVSSHNPGGDSPAPRATRPRASSSSKRAREGSIHEAYATDDDGLCDDANSRLMPPLSFEPHAYADESEDRAGLSPAERGSEQVASINQLAEKREIDERNAGVQDWLSKSETGSVIGVSPDELAAQRGRQRNYRPRAHTTGAQLDPRSLPLHSGRYIPGPGVLLDEPSDDGLSYDGSTYSELASPVPDSPPVSPTKLKQQHDAALDQSFFTAFDAVQLSPESEEPLPSQFIRRSPWQDPFRGPITHQQTQPQSSNDAVRMFDQAAANWDSASRAATWGTGRILNEQHSVNAVVDGSRVRHPSLVKRSSYIVNKARGLIPRRSSSNIKKDCPWASPDCEPSQPEAAVHREAASPRKALQRIPSFSKPKSPSLTTGSAIMAMTGNLAAVGGGRNGPFPVEPEKSDSLRAPFNVLRKSRSKSEAPKPSTKASPGLADLIRGHGGPPMPTLASPRQELLEPLASDAGRVVDPLDNATNEVAVRMDLSIRTDNIIPTLEGFKANIQELNPRLPQYLIQRLGQEQHKRYKSLLESRIQHDRAVKVLKKCSSGSHCTELGGKATLLPPRNNAKDAESVGAQFQIGGPADGEVDESTLEEEGVVTPAQFPAGIPLPPVNRLPAQFECFLCYDVKKLNKPSDWTKHVHEDTQPFTCTFPNCSEAKSFKRKADWVRHENELHRRLEYWDCNVPGCKHRCYRKDNFVQHLNREHKKGEPKAKSRGSGNSKAQANPSNPGSQTPLDDELSRIVESCRYESQASPRDEPCRFCGNVCNSWKKLSVHLGKHMEQIALQVIELVKSKQVEVGPDTWVSSPTDLDYVQTSASATTSGAISTPQVQTVDDADTPSSYTMNTRSTYQGSPASLSPVPMLTPHISAYPFGHAYHPQTLPSSVLADLGQDNPGQYTADSSNITSTGLYVPGTVNTSSQAGGFSTDFQPQPVLDPGSGSQSMPSYTPTQMPYTSPNLSPYPNYALTSASISYANQFEPHIGAINSHLVPDHAGTAGEYAYPTPQVYDEKQQYQSYI